MPELPVRAPPAREIASTSQVAAFRSTPQRTVFTESGNPDGWIATDLTVPLGE
jgi:hypothetical protein